MCLLLNVYASWSWRKESFVGEEQCYQGLTAEHVMIVVDFIEGVRGMMVEEAVKKAVGKQTKEAVEGKKEAVARVEKQIRHAEFKIMHLHKLLAVVSVGQLQAMGLCVYRNNNEEKRQKGQGNGKGEREDEHRQTQGGVGQGNNLHLNSKGH
jgi:hypothetical protein